MIDSLRQRPIIEPKAKREEGTAALHATTSCPNLVSNTRLLSPGGSNSPLIHLSAVCSAAYTDVGQLFRVVPR